MFFFLLLVYCLSLFFFFFDLNVFIVNEEFLIFICMLILFFLLTSSVRKFIKLNFFFKIEFIYFFFIYLISLNINLINKLLNFISLENLKINSLILSEIYNFYNESINEIISSEKLINLYLTKNIILLLNSNSYFSYILSTSSNFLIQLLFINNKLIQSFKLYDLRFHSLIYPMTFSSSLKYLISSILYYKCLDFYNTLNSSNINVINNSILYSEINFFIKKSILNFLK